MYHVFGCLKCLQFKYTVYKLLLTQKTELLFNILSSMVFFSIAKTYLRYLINLKK